jgi:hypothetical protein
MEAVGTKPRLLIGSSSKAGLHSYFKAVDRSADTGLDSGPMEFDPMEAATGHNPPFLANASISAIDTEIWFGWRDEQDDIAVNRIRLDFAKKMLRDLEKAIAAAEHYVAAARPEIS